MTPDMQDHLERMLTRLKLTAIRDQRDNLIDEAGRGDLTIREALTMFCEREIARKDQRRIEMSFGLARFPFVRDLVGFDFSAQPSIDKAQVRGLSTDRQGAGPGAVHRAVRCEWRGGPVARPARRRETPPGRRHRPGRDRRGLFRPVRARDNLGRHAGQGTG